MIQFKHCIPENIATLADVASLSKKFEQTNGHVFLTILLC